MDAECNLTSIYFNVNQHQNLVTRDKNDRYTLIEMVISIRNFNFEALLHLWIRSGMVYRGFRNATPSIFSSY